MGKKAVLVVSFGTSYPETLEKTIAAVENRLKKAFSDCKIYRAFTSRMIKQKLQREGTLVSDVKEALEQILADGVTKLLVQPTHMIHGVEYERMLKELFSYAGRFESLRCGQPLLSCTEDYKELASAIHKEYPADEDEALVLMGHGSGHPANSAYPAFAYVLQDMGYHNIFVGTVEGYPAFSEVKKQLEEKNFQRVCLAPMMIVAGDHANNDMIGAGDSWKVVLEQEGYEVRYYMKGLGELTEVQNMFLRHAKEAFLFFR